MAEKNTLSILESIRKKIQKLDEPRKTDNKDFSDIGDEFDYVAPAKKNAPVQSAQEASSLEPEPLKTDNTIEHEITESFELGDEQKFEQSESLEPIAQELEKEDANINFAEDAEKDLEVIEATSVSIENIAEPVDEDEDLFEFDDDDSAEEMPDLKDDDFELNSEINDKTDEELEDSIQPEEDVVAEEDSVEKIAEEPEELPLVEVKPEEEVEKSDEDELEDLLKQEAATKTEDVKVMPVKPVASVVPPVISSQPKVADLAQKTFTNVDEFLTHSGSEESLLNKQAASNITDSIKKLVDAKNVVSGVTSFSKSEAFADIAAQLMEPRLEKWLNENLPSLVEKIVRDEIKKIIPKE